MNSICQPSFLFVDLIDGNLRYKFKSQRESQKWIKYPNTPTFG